MILTPVSIISGLHKLSYGRFPRPLFRLVAWAWPYRPQADAGVLIASAIYAAPDKFEGDEYGISGKLNGERISVSLRSYQTGRAGLMIGKLKNIPISAWGDYQLDKARRWLKRRAERQASTVVNNSNREIAVEGTRLAAELIAREFEPQRSAVPEFETQARYLAGRQAGSEFSDMITIEAKPRRSPRGIK
jgi:hypothetical protein